MVYYVADYLALILLWVIFSGLHKNNVSAGNASRLFTISLFTNILFALSNIFIGILDTYVVSAPLLIHGFVHSVYYLFACLMVYLYARYILTKFIGSCKHTASGHAFFVLLDAILVICLILCLTSPKTGLVFSFDEAGRYCQGPIWIICYIEVGLMSLTLFISMAVCRTRASASLMNMMIILVPLVFFIVAFRFVFPQILFEGMAGAVTALFLFQHYQTNSLETDFLTRLGNLNSMSATIDRLNQRQQHIQVILLSLRNFSNINGTYGYEFGNTLLSELARWLERFYHGNTQLFRFGAVSFVIILPYESQTVSEEQLHRLIDAFPKNWTISGNRLGLSPFFADLCFLERYNTTQVMEELDYARKKVKYSTLDHMHFDALLYTQLQRKKYIIQYLDQSIRTERFDVWFQPILCTGNDCFCSAEALVRLQDSDGVFIAPDEFIPIAEETGQICAINEIVLDRVCRFLSDNPQLPISSVSVNLTLAQLQSPDFPEHLNQKCSRYGIEHTRIGLELTERMLISEVGAIHDNLVTLHNLGYRLLLDDFGTGYSNFSNVLQHPLEKIKLDKSLLWETGSDYHVIKMLIDLFHQNGQKVVIEGVESAAQCRFLLEHHADFLQGYYYSRPLPPARYRDFMLAHLAPGSCPVPEAD